MKKALSRLTSSLIILSLMVLSCCPAFAFETKAIMPQIEILTPGMTRTIKITQNYNFPQETSQFLILVIGYGGLGITLTKNDTEGDVLILTGVGVSAAGVIPVLKFGVTHVTLYESVEIGNERSPYGLVWLSSWVSSSENDPPYSYTLTLRF